MLTIINALLFYGIAKFQQKKYRRGSSFWRSCTCAYFATVTALFTLLVWLSALWMYAWYSTDLSWLVVFEGADVFLLGA